MSWPDTWAGEDPAPDPLRIRILGALAWAALGYAAAGDTRTAAAYEDAYMQVATGTTQWCDLSVKLISEMN